MSRSALSARRRRTVAVFAVVVSAAIGGAAAGLAAGPAIRSPAQAAADAAPPAPSLVTVLAQRKVLTENVTARGVVVPGNAAIVAAPPGLAGDTAVVTAVHARSGATLREGTACLEVAGGPLFGLALPFPLYRDLTPEARGPDVAAVQKALRRLGYSVPDSGVLDAVTREGVRRFYRDRGYSSPAFTGGPVLPRSQVVRLNGTVHRISAVRVAVGTVLSEPATPLLELDVAPPTVTVTLPANQRTLIAVGSTADVTDEVGGTTTTASVRDVADRATQTEQGDGYVVSLAFTGPPLVAGKDRTVQVTIASADRSGPVLAVPVTAVNSRPDGGTFVTVATDERHTVDVPVRTGRSGGGWVEVTPEQGTIDVGTAVVVGAARAHGDGG